MECSGTENCYLTIKEYDKLAKKIVKKYGKNAKFKVLNDDEALSHIVYRLARADQKFNGHGIRESFRVKNGIYALYDVIKNYSKSYKTNNISLSSIVYKNKKYFPLENIIEDKRYSIENKIFFQEILDIIKNSNEFTAQEKNVILWRYYERWPYKEIARALNVKSSRVYFIRDTALMKLFGELYETT